ncbi:hypothetical protein QQS21_011507 [Conoideocrella luteorostrata]|uniref:Extracellular protein n=1 Tax=Conoideocrella luteorostrata TaxID=1105319 RepID=A0AAJ0FNI1_9HYPO|nr:hypothetical protein QQS21_011507 [Conoideocrella luteorostrata]
MKTSSGFAAVILSLISFGAAHMEMIEPPPLGSKSNKFSIQPIDYDMKSPVTSANFPCRGHHKLVGTPQGQPVAVWAPGQTYKMTITGTASHGGGSCQASLSYDGGKTWKVIHSYIGGCPVSGTSSFSFALPSDAPTGDALFAWTWFNNIGNREMYMNCASITVAGSAKKSRKARAASGAFSSRPDMFVANINNGCSTVPDKDLLFPNPGPDVTNMKSTNTNIVGSTPENCGSPKAK